MNLHSIQTDNARLANKIALRRRATADLDRLRVLDLYAGRNLLWSYFDKEKYFGVDIQQNKGQNLTADSRRIVETLDLSAFNVIDCDSYGIPFDVLYKLLQNDTLQDGTVILYTAITRARELLVMVGDDAIPGRMAENDRRTRRYSGLRRRLMQGGGSDGASG